MEVRYLPDNNAYKRMTTEELRKNFLVENLFSRNKINLVYTDADRAIIGSAVPLNKPLELQASKKEMAADYFTERREVGIINIGNDGEVVADKKVFKLKNKDVLYIGRGTKQIKFISKNPKNPARFYFVSYPAHKDFSTMIAKKSDVISSKLGSKREANQRTIYKFIHPGGIKSCQLVMGFTELEVGSIWNTMPAHTHMRRSEIYAYFDIEKDSAVFHFMGEEKETRNLVIRNEQVVISPSWSLHAGAGTKNYTFIWAMGGENQAFDDMDLIPINELL